MNMKEQNLKTGLAGRASSGPSTGSRTLRNRKIVALFKSGVPGTAIAQELGLSRERVRQILLKHGIQGIDGGASLKDKVKTGGKNLKTHASKMILWGVTLEEWKRLNALKNPLGESPFNAFVRYRHNNARGRRFTLTFLEWWSLWEESGLWMKKGTPGEKISLARIDPDGPVSKSNLRVVWHRK